MGDTDLIFSAKCDTYSMTSHTDHRKSRLGKSGSDTIDRANMTIGEQHNSPVGS